MDISEWSHRLHQWEYSPESVAHEFNKTMSKLYDHLFRVQLVVNPELFERVLSTVMQRESQIQEYLYQEMLTKRAFKDSNGNVTVHPLDSTIRLVQQDSRITEIQNIPLPLVTYGGKVKVPMKHHQDRQWIRRNEFWDAFIHYLTKNNAPMRSASEELSAPRRPLLYAKVSFVFRSSSMSEMREVNHFMPSLESIVNALRYHGLIASDSAGHLSLETKWQSEDLDWPKVNLVIEQADRPL